MKAIIYLFGTAVLVVGILYGLNAAGVEKRWLLTTGLIVGGLGIMGASKEYLSLRRVTKTEVDSSGNSKTTETEVSADTV